MTKKELALERTDKVGGSLRIMMTLWDIMGERGVRDPLTDAYLNGTHGILAVCDVTGAKTLTNLSA